MPSATLTKFTAQAGVKVNLEVLSWDSIHNKIVTAEGAGTAPADVTEFDWSSVGQFNQAGWYTPLNRLISPKVQSHSIPIKVFTVKHKILAVPYDLGHRATLLNWTDFKRAGIPRTPSTWSQLLADAMMLKQRHVVQYPIAQPLSVIKNTSTAFYALVKSEGANFFYEGVETSLYPGRIGGRKSITIRESPVSRQASIPGNCGHPRIRWDRISERFGGDFA